jgi:amino acid adenylation domain-containing protein
MSRPASTPENLNQKIAALTPAQRQLLAQRLQAQGVQVQNFVGIPARSPDVECPLSFAQQRLWFIQQLNPDSITYNVPCALRIQGPLVISALQQAIEQLVDRHETLRTRFATNAAGQPIQIIDPSQAVKLEQIDFRQVAIEQREQETRAHIQAMADRPVNLAETTTKWQLLQLAGNASEEVDGDYVLLILSHHIICDRWSIGVFLRDFAILYSAALRQLPNPLTAMPIQYADWAIWQQQELQGDRLQQQSDYWRQQLAGTLPILNLPHDRLLAIEQEMANQVAIDLPIELSQQLRDLASRQDVTLFMLLLATFQVLLYHYTSQEDIVIGSDIVNRDRRETEGLIGLLVNTLVLRTDLSQSPSFTELLQRVREVTLQAYAHQQFPFEKIVEMLNPERDLQQHTPLFQVKFDLQLAKVDTPSLAGLQLTRVPIIDRSPKYDLRLNLQDNQQGISGQFEFDASQFSQATIARMADHWQILLTEIVENPHQLIADCNILTPAEQAQFENWNQTQRDYPRTTLHQLFEAQAERSPLSSALVCGSQVTNYQTLNQRANQLAHYLHSLNAVDQRPIGILLDRNETLIVAMLAVLKSGAAYMPLDPTYPFERLQFLIEDAGIGVLISDRDYATPFGAIPLVHLSSQAPAIAQQSDQNLNIDIADDDLAYLIYTSGSTGKPKGVAITHHSPAVLAHWAKETFALPAWRGVLASTSVCFDLSIFEIFVPLCWGGCVILAENAMALPEAQRQLPTNHAITLINTVPSAIRTLLEQQAIPDTTEVINLAGEALSASLVQQLYQLPQIQTVYNLYGPSEDTTYSTYVALPRNIDRVTIGKPIANTAVCLLNSAQKPVPTGVAGELYLSGSGLAQGYWQRERLTSDRFIKYQGKRWYRTGDQARFLPNGELEYLGRLDEQIKLRGYRIELGEIATCLETHPQIQQAIILLSNAQSAETNSRQVLIACYLGDTIAASDLQTYLSHRLPSYMVPALYVRLEEFPLTTNGKVDRQALQHSIQIPQSLDYIAPTGSIEQRIADIWQQELGLEGISIHDNFFSLGGHSLLGMRIIAKVGESCGQNIPLKYLFQFPTIAQLASQLLNEFPRLNDLLPNLEPGQNHSLIIADHKNRHQPFPLTAIQQAYLIGRDRAFELGNISTHAYREIETVGLTIPQVEAALNQLINRHDMLRMQVTPTGEQQILPQVPFYQIPTINLRDQTTQEQERILEEHRNQLSHQVLDVYRYPLFYVQALQLTDDRVRFCIGFDILLGDAWSFQLLGQDFLNSLNQITPPPLTLSFRDYVLATQHLKETEQYQRSYNYWYDRLSTLPESPALPLAKPLSAITKPQFNRYSGKLKASDWAALKSQAAQQQVTPSSLVLAAFAEVLRRWSGKADFTLNLTLFNRSPLHLEVNQIVGDFTASSLLEVQYCDSFTDRVKQIQAQLWQDLEHRVISGVEVLRMLAQQRQQPTAALMPIVFTSTLTQPIPALPSDRSWQSEVVYSISQTSQVYLDHQVAEIDGELNYNWDVIEELFPPGLIGDMFTAYERLLCQLAGQPQVWENPQSILLSETTQQALKEYNQTEVAFNQSLKLQDLFFQQVDRTPDHLAIISSSQQLTYQQLRDRVLQVAQTLIKHNISPQTPIPIIMAKGWEQIVAVLAVLSVGAIYVPIDPELPTIRIQQIIDSTEATLALTQSVYLESLKIQHGNELNLVAIDELADFDQADYIKLQSRSCPTDLAYIIYTSGSTGVPKGVMIDHRGAVNTILDINRRWQVTANDRILALSSLSFDLSVYDIFGVLAVGGAIVLPDVRQLQQVKHWHELVQTHRITLWNSVPALFQLYADYYLSHPKTMDAPQANPLRLAWLSGDWISPQLIQEIQQVWPTLSIVSLGGATEASIWSIFHAIQPMVDSPANWQTIPYGRPLANQQMYILDRFGNSCPTWVMGDIYIAGVGVAQGYWGDSAQTESAFKKDLLPTVDRLYRTGDLGRYRYWNDPAKQLTMEFMGRSDFQVKLNGYRIELNEISRALEAHAEIQQAIVQIIGTDNRQQLVAYLKLRSNPNQSSQKFSRLDPKGQLEFRQQQHNLYRPQLNQAKIVLPDIANTVSDRRSYRQFLPQTVSLERIVGLLSSLRLHSDKSQYNYPSAGSLYPVQAYIYIRHDRVDELPAGLYYYHPNDHALIQISQNTAWPGKIYGINQDIFEQSAFAIFLIAQMAAIKPVYGERSRDFCLLEAGYIGQLLMQQASSHSLGLCPIGDLEFAEIAPDFQISEQQELLHSFVGGIVDPAKSELSMNNPKAQKATWLQAKLKQDLEQQLPSYMVPQHFVLLDEVPLSANGKVDLKALPTPQFESADCEFAPPQTETEIKIAKIWKTVLQISHDDQDTIGIDDNFFDRGGNSLSLMQIVSQIQQEYSVEMSIATFFNQPTIRQQAIWVKAQQSSQEPVILSNDSPISTSIDLAAIDIDRLSEAELDALLARGLAEEVDSSITVSASQSTSEPEVES